MLVRHALRLGYLSDRHTLTLVAVSIPWAAAGTFVCARGIAMTLGWEHRRARAVGAAAVALADRRRASRSSSKPSHPSRWGHWAAGRWLVAHAGPADAVLDTRGWAAFVSGRPSYDYWHVRQAFTDAHLAYIVVGDRRALGRRAGGPRRLRAVLAYAADAGRGVPRAPRRQGDAASGSTATIGPLLGGPAAMSHGSFWERLVRGTAGPGSTSGYRDALPADLDATVMDLESRDRFHAKQGRSTARVVFHAAAGPLPVYLKRHYRLPWRARLAALIDPAGRHTPGAAEWAHLERARALGIAVPEVVAAGERIGPWGDAAELPDGRRADRLPPAARGHARARRHARPRGLRRLEARP